MGQMIYSREDLVKFNRELSSGCEEENSNPTLKWDFRFLQLAETIAKWSKDPSTQCGAVIINPRQFVVSVAHKELPLRVLHVVEDALLFANRPLDGCTMYTYPMLPCSNCAAKIIQVGVTRVVSVECRDDDLRERWSLDLSAELFCEAGVEVALID